MVHACKPAPKLGFGVLSALGQERLHLAIEAGYVVASITFVFGTVCFFPVSDLQDFDTGCRWYEVGSLMFCFLTFYVEFDGYVARYRTFSRRVTKRELTEQGLYCGGSFLFLIGTYMYDPPLVRYLSSKLDIEMGVIEDVASLFFMIGSLMFSLAAYVNALSIFEAPAKLRKRMLTITTSYMCGGLLFVSGTMGYVHAFEPNRTMVWVATWMYMIGSFFYLMGGALSFYNTVISQERRARLQSVPNANELAKALGVTNHYNGTNFKLSVQDIVVDSNSSDDDEESLTMMMSVRVATSASTSASASQSIELSKLEPSIKPLNL